MTAAGFAGRFAPAKGKGRSGAAGKAVVTGSSPYMVTIVSTIFDITLIYGLFYGHPMRRILHKSCFLYYFHIYYSLHRMVTIMHLQMTNRTESMLRITTEKKRGKIFLGVEGRLAAPLGAGPARKAQAGRARGLELRRGRCGD